MACSVYAQIRHKSPTPGGGLSLACPCRKVQVITATLVAFLSGGSSLRRSCPRGSLTHPGHEYSRAPEEGRWHEGLPSRKDGASRAPGSAGEQTRWDKKIFSAPGAGRVTKETKGRGEESRDRGRGAGLGQAGQEQLTHTAGRDHEPGGGPGATWPPVRASQAVAAGGEAPVGTGWVTRKDKRQERLELSE